VSRSSSGKSDTASQDPAPAATPRPEKRVVHGIDLVDDYAWLRDPNWREVMRDPGRLDPAIRSYLEA
jgi:oligopeptidase B